MQFGWENAKGKIQRTIHFDNKYLDNPQLYESLLLYQIGDLVCDGGLVIGDHIQYCYEISYIVSGSGYYYSDRHPYPVEEGDVFLCLPHEQHDGKADTVDPFRYFYVGFGFEECMDEHNLLTHIKKMFDQVQKPIIKDKFGIQIPFLNIFNELINPKNYSPLMIKTYLYQIIVMTYRNFFDNWEKEYAPQNNCDETKKVAYEVINYIDTNLSRIVGLNVIADELGYSYSHLSHVFSKEIGLSINEYYTRKRFKKAIEWLKGSDDSITNIAEMLNYQTIHTFSKAFRKRFGISPSEYRFLHTNHN